MAILLCNLTKLIFDKDILDKVRNLPELPGVYRFLNKNGKIIYIGKAKHLRKRVTSYFSGFNKHSRRIKELVIHAKDVAYTITNNEVEALTLENNLIKNHKPKYNILLKDGKTYPFIAIRNERFPRIVSTRIKENDGSEYFGPYTSVGAMNSILNLIRGYIKIRNCSYNLSEENIQAEKFRPCMEYHVKNCAAPCVGYHSEEEYMQGIALARNILKGNLKPVTENLENRMKEAAENYEYELAAFYKKRIEQILQYKRKNTIISPRLNDLEVLTVAAESNIAIVNHFKVENGAIIQTHSWEMTRKHEEEQGEILLAAFEHLKGIEKNIFSSVITNAELPEDDELEGYTFGVPQKGDKRHLIELSLKTCFTLLKEKIFNQQFGRSKPNEVMVEELKTALHMKSLPDHIECFDNSNLQGSFPVASMVVFKEGKPSKKDYRHFNIKTVEGPNDFASMEEVVYRRYKRLKDEGKPLPKLIVIDGGKGQLSSAAASLKKLDLIDKIPVIGIAKRLEEIFRLNDPIPLYIDKKSPALKLIQQLRNEAHRFAITFHRDKRSNALKKGSSLLKLKGIGETSARKILTEFKSIKKLKAAPEAELRAKLGPNLAKIIIQAKSDGKI